MKRFLKLCTAVFLSAAVFCSAGCSARTPVTADEFKKQAEAADFKISETPVSNGNVEKYVSALKEETESEIVFILFKNDNLAYDTYSSIKSGLSNAAGGTSKNVDSSSYNKFTFQKGELNHTLVRMNNTVVYGKAVLSDTDQMNEVFKNIKY